jgi:carboxypeptidase family protein
MLWKWRLALNSPSYFAIGCFALIIFAPVKLHAQVVGATISGTLTDISGGSIPKARISIRNVDSGLDREILTDAAGFYTAPNLQPGTYVVSATAPGFATMRQTSVTLTVGSEQVVNFKMLVGSFEQRVEVSSEAINVELDSSSMGSVVDSTTIRELPLNGRSWTDLSSLEPGVQMVMPS